MKTTQVCRCCLTEACFKDISNEYIINGKKEVYANMLLEVFNIHISYQGDSSRLICEACVGKLRDAADFKIQVESAERAIINNMIGEPVCNGSDLLNKLTSHEDYNDDFLDYITGEFDDESDDMKCSGDEFQWPDDDNDDEGIYAVKMEPDDAFILETQKKSRIKNLSTKKRKKVNQEKVDKTVKEKSLKSSTRKRVKSLSQINAKENTLKLINNSNICLFDSLKTKFRCFYCKNSYLNITELREHSSVHSNPSYLKMCINRLQGMSYKNVDISDLQCKICLEPLKDLVDLQKHLTVEHSLEFTVDNHLLIPYKLENGFQCVLCENKYNSFFKLSIHMNSHYSNHVCDICGVFYINRLSLRMHVNSMHKEKKCSLCPAIFPSTYARVKHMRKVHNTSQPKRYCLICNKTFRYSYLLNEHKIQEHGMKRQVTVCIECGKHFPSTVNLNTHFRSVHLKERNHHCSYCGMSFFTSCDKRRHERTHQDVRLFSCGYCEGRFKSKDSLRRHLKRQHGNLFLSNSEHNIILN